MINILRKHSQWLMVSITILVIISFVVLYNSTQFQNIGRGTLATIYGQALAKDDYERYARQARLAQSLGLYELLQLGAAQGGLSVEAYTVNNIVVEHSATELGIEPTEDQVESEIKGLPAFQTNNGFDPTKYQTFLSEQLPPLGFTGDEVEKLVRLDLKLKQLRSLIASTVPASAVQFRQLYTLQNQKMIVSFVDYKLSDFEAKATVTDDELKKAYAQRKDTLKSAEQRSVDYVAFKLTDEQKKLTDKARVDAQQKLADQAQAFAEATLDKGAQFDAVAAKSEIKVLNSGLFTQDKPPTALANVSTAAQSAFNLTKDQPISDVIQTEDAFYVLHLAAIVPSKPLTFDEARAQLTTTLKSEHANSTLSQQAAENHAKLEEALKKGQTFTQAAQALGLKVVTAPTFSIAEPPTDETVIGRDIMYKSAELADGQLSSFTPSATGGFIVHMDKREPLDNAKFAKDKDSQLPMYEQQQQEMAFDQWLNDQRDAANYKMKAS
ncbi:MAG: SurA N-terminal domain-containing protein [Chthoniobacteraceae bacterium]